MLQCCGKQDGSFSENHTELSCELAIPLLDTHAKALKAGVQTGTCTPVFTAAIITTAKKWKQPKRPVVEEWINKVRFMLLWFSREVVSNSLRLDPL